MNANTARPGTLGGGGLSDFGVQGYSVVRVRPGDILTPYSSQKVWRPGTSAKRVARRRATACWAFGGGTTWSAVLFRQPPKRRERKREEDESQGWLRTAARARLRWMDENPF
jgi:hypothetical protein